MAEGLGVDDQRYARFFWYPSPQALQSVPFEPVTTDLAHEFRLEFRESLNLPGPHSLRGKCSREEMGAYLNGGERERPRHQLLGRPWGIQYDPRESTKHRNVDEWQRLWQIDSDENVGFEWIDEGMLYILVFLHL